MNTPTNAVPITQRSEIARFCRWLLSPRRLRVCGCIVISLVTLVCLFYAVESVRGKLAWNKVRSQLEAAGEKLELQAIAPPPAPDDQNFAMTPFFAPLFDFKPGTQEWRDTNAVERSKAFGLKVEAESEGKWVLGKKTDWLEWAQLLKLAVPTNNTATVAAAVLAALEKDKDVLAELKAASQRPYCRFNIRYDNQDPAAILLPHLARIKGIVRLLALRASAKLACGQTDSAIEDLTLGFYLADSVKNEPVLISYLVRCATLRLMVQPLWEGMVERRWSETQLRHLQRRLEQFDFWTDAVFALKGERTFGNGIIAHIRRNPHLLIHYSGMDNPVEVMPSMSWAEGLLWKAIPRGWFDLEQAQYNLMFQRFVLLSDQEVSKRQIDPGKMTERTEHLEKELSGSAGFRIFRKHRVMSAMLLPALTGIHKKAAYTQSLIDQAVLACAIERYRLAKGALPESLEVLAPEFVSKLPHDVIGGGPVHYRRERDIGFTLYAIGWNAKDDGGQVGRTQRGRFDGAQGDWVWSTPQ